LLGLVLLGLPGCPPPPDPAYFDDSVYLLTLNVRMIPETWDDFCCSQSNEWRAKKIGDYLRNSDYDIISLTEVFDEDSRDAFESRLKGRYPYYVYKIEDHGMEDSGLMLFSRFPFEPLPNPPAPSDYDAEAYSQGSDWNDVAIVEYDYCHSYDCDADKAGAMVRVRNPATNRILNVAFSHTQASYGDGNCRCEVDARTHQFSKMRNMILNALGDLFDHEEVLLLGDLNVDGDQLMWERDNSTNPGYYATFQCLPISPEAPCTSNLWEWIMRFDTSGQFYSDSMIDAWVFEQSPYDPDHPFDRGLTQGLPIPVERLDYVLRNRTGRQFCTIQHLPIERNARKAGGHILSDHLGVRVDFNRRSPYCRPVDAYWPPMDTVFNGNIQFQGSMQWFRINKAGTYIIATVGTGIQHEVYESKDLTVPWPQYHNETETINIHGKPFQGDVYVLPEAPFYIRAFNENRAQTSGYNFIAHRSNGSSMSDAIRLIPGLPYEYEDMPPNQPLNPQDEAWFKFHVEKSDSKLPQELGFHITGFAEDILDAELRRSDGTTVIETHTTAEADPDNPGKLRLHWTTTEADIGTGPFYLLVQREQVKDVEFSVMWTTPLTVVHGDVISGACDLMMFCVEETDLKRGDIGGQPKQGGLDEIYLTIRLDGEKIVDDVFIGHYDDDYTFDLDPDLGNKRFVDNVKVTLRDDDDNNADDYFHFNIPALPLDAWQSLGSVQSDAGNDGEYQISFNRTRTLMDTP